MLVIRGRELPGASHLGHGRIGVALQVRTDPVGVVAGDAADARWETDVAVVGDDFRGPAVHGRRGRRLGGGRPAGLLVHGDDVGERSPGVDADTDPAGGAHGQKP